MRDEGLQRFDNILVEALNEQWLVSGYVLPSEKHLGGPALESSQETFQSDVEITEIKSVTEGDVILHSDAEYEDVEPYIREILYKKLDTKEDARYDGGYYFNI